MDGRRNRDQRSGQQRAVARGDSHLAAQAATA